MTTGMRPATSVTHPSVTHPSPSPPRTPAPGGAGKTFHVVVDPGHGGIDHGTVFKDDTHVVTEKDVTLLLAQDFVRELRAAGLTATLTRDEDKDIALPDRTAMANRLEADLFISIHMNSQPVGHKNFGGVETYILNNSTNESSIRLADLENKVLKDSAATSSKSAAAAKSDVALIVKDLILDGNLKTSKLAACQLQDALVHVVQSPDKKNRGVKQGLFYVLLGADMPSVLVEAGFLDHPTDRALALSANGRKKMATAMTQAVLKFRKLRGTPASGKILTRCKIN
jgi:N-acetylmuramoyl-L-alanine amidase